MADASRVGRIGESACLIRSDLTNGIRTTASQSLILPFWSVLKVWGYRSASGDVASRRSGRTTSGSNLVECDTGIGTAPGSHVGKLP